MRRLRRTNHTLLLVCEGYAEVELARFIRDCYLPRDCGIALSYENARGSGGAHALDLIVERQRQTVFDAYGVLIDTDSNWDDDERRRAQNAGIVCIENTPCIEATLLTVAGHKARPTSRENKQEFERLYGSPAHRPGVIARHFNVELLNAARTRVIAIDQFLRFLRR